jgi:hypothetical protein
MNKSLLAKLMAQEDLTVIEGNFETASFNPTSRELRLPLLKEEYLDAYNLFIGHEVGHALYTPDFFSHESKAEDVSDIPFSILNIVEDVRIERKIRNFYPGLVNDFIKGYKFLIKNDFFGIKGKDVNALSFLDRLNLRAKLNSSIDLVFSPSEVKMMNKVFAIETFDDTVKISRELMEFIKSEEEEEEPTTDSAESPEGDTGPEDDDSGSGNNGQERDENNEQERDEKESTVSENDGGDPQFESLTDKSYRNKEAEMVQDPTGTCYIKVTRDQVYNKYVQTEQMLLDSQNELRAKLDKHSINPDDWNSTIEEEYKKFIADVKPSVAAMVQQFELKKSANSYSKIRESKTGTVDVNKLWSYKLDDNIFKVNTLLPNSKNHGMLMYIDFSASMSDVIHETAKQAIVLSMFARRVGIPHELYSFTSNDGFGRGYAYRGRECDDPMTYTGNGFKDNAIKMVKLADSTWSKKKQSEMFQRLFGSTGEFDAEYTSHNNGETFNRTIKVAEPAFRLVGTPLVELSAISLLMAKDFENKHKPEKMNVVFLTDGEAQAIRLTEPRAKEGTQFNRIRFKNYTIDIEGYGRINGEVSLGEGFGRLLPRAVKKIIFKHIRAKYNFIGFFLTDQRRLVNSHVGYTITENENNDIFSSAEGYSTYITVFTKIMHAMNEDFTPRTDDTADYKDVNDKTRMNHIKADFKKHQGKKKTGKLIAQTFARLVA